MFLNLSLVTVSSSELSVFEHRKLWCLQTLCWLHGERSLPIGLIVVYFSFSPMKISVTVFLTPIGASVFKGSLTLAMGNCLWFSVKIKVCQSALSSP